MWLTIKKRENEFSQAGVSKSILLLGQEWVNNMKFPTKGAFAPLLQ